MQAVQKWLEQERLAATGPEDASDPGFAGLAQHEPRCLRPHGQHVVAARKVTWPSAPRAGLPPGLSIWASRATQVADVCGRQLERDRLYGQQVPGPEGLDVVPVARPRMCPRAVAGTKKRTCDRLHSQPPIRIDPDVADLRRSATTYGSSATTLLPNSSIAPMSAAGED